MIEYLRGKLVAVMPGKAVVEVGAVGIALEIPELTGGLEQLVGSEVLFHTRLLLRDDDLRLIGFRAAEDRDLFDLITAVSGFGP
ncbi:MAG: Holliday junction branch migration protein RuvA, partial [Firmicutes bacterium]|nr:Holliday junction branch migration protein RuvA [Bacillota bacterium]